MSVGYDLEERDCENKQIFRSNKKISGTEENYRFLRQLFLEHY